MSSLSVITAGQNDVKIDEVSDTEKWSSLIENILSRKIVQKKETSKQDAHHPKQYVVKLLPTRDEKVVDYLRKVSNPRQHRLQDYSNELSVVSLCYRLSTERNKIRLDKKTHIYRRTSDELKGETITVGRSVTQLLDEICGCFDASIASARMLLNKSRWRANKLYKYCNFDENGNALSKKEIQERIKSSWSESAERGTVLHSYIDNMYTGREYGFELAAIDRDNIAAVKHWEEIRINNGWLLLDCEMPIYSFSMDLCGTVDAIYVPDSAKPNQVVIVDWKRAEVRTLFKNGCCYEHDCLKRYAKSNYWRYCFQLNAYRAILENRRYGLHVIEMLIVSFPPGRRQCEIVGVPRMTEIDYLFFKSDNDHYDDSGKNDDDYDDKIVQ